MSNQPTTTTKSDDTVEEKLLKEFSQMFLRENLENNNYLIYRMSMNLEIPLQTIYNERGIKAITQENNLILNALKKTPNLTVDEEKEFVVPQIESMKNKVIVNINQNEEEKFKKFLIEKKFEDSDIEFVYDRPACCKLIFPKDEKASKFVETFHKKEFYEKTLEAYIEPENIYLTFLQNAHESKKPNDRFGFPPKHNYDQMNYYQPYNMYQPPMMGSPYYYAPYYPPPFNSGYYNPYVSTMYIRRAKIDDEHPEEYEEKYEQRPPAHDKQWEEKGQDHEEGKYHSGRPYYSYSKRGKRGSRYPPRGYKRYVEHSKHPTNRVRVNSDNFPPLNEQKNKKEGEEEGNEEIKIKYTKTDVSKLYHELQGKGEIQMNENLKKFKEDEIPFLKKHSSRKVSGI